MKSICVSCANEKMCKVKGLQRGVSVITGCYNFKPAERTQGDAIRSMTDKELAAFLCKVDGDFPPNIPQGGISLNKCEEYWLKWLEETKK